MNVENFDDFGEKFSKYFFKWVAAFLSLYMLGVEVAKEVDIEGRQFVYFPFITVGGLVVLFLAIKSFLKWCRADKHVTMWASLGLLGFTLLNIWLLPLILILLPKLKDLLLYEIIYVLFLLVSILGSPWILNVWLHDLTEDIFHHVKQDFSRFLIILFSLLSLGGLPFGIKMEKIHTAKTIKQQRLDIVP